MPPSTSNPTLTPEALAAVLEENRDRLIADLPQIYDRLLEGAHGITVLRTLKKKTSKDGEVCEEAEDVTENEDLCPHCGRTGQPGKQAWLYTTPPNFSVLNRLYEHAAGRAAQKSAQAGTTIINVVHALPGRPDFYMEDAEQYDQHPEAYQPEALPPPPEPPVEQDPDAGLFDNEDV